MTLPLHLLHRRPPLLAPLSRGLSLGVGLGLTAFFATTFQRSPPILLDSFPSSSSSSSSSDASAALPPPRVPVFKNGRVNPDAYGQISTGSILGLLGGLAVATFSRTLAVLFGLVVFGVQFAASKGYFLPMGRIQRSIKGVDLRAALRDNMAFKLSFGLTFMLAAFAEL